MERVEMKKISTNQVAKNDAILSQAIEANGLVFVSGQIHANTTWKLIGETNQEKFDICMKNIEAILDAASCSLHDIVKLTIFTTDMAAIPEINEVYSNYFGETLPAREAIGVASLPLGASMEVVAIASAGKI